MKTNVAVRNTRVTHEGAPAKSINAEQELRRSVLACLLWEDSFYEDGVSIAKRISDTVKLVDPRKVSQLAVDARTKFNLRHAPLLLVRAMANYPKAVADEGLVASTLWKVIQRPDELTEFLSIYWKEIDEKPMSHFPAWLGVETKTKTLVTKRQPLSAQVKKGLASAFTKFDAYQLAKYNRDGAIKLRDVLFLCHAKPLNKEQEKTWKQLVDDKLPIPNTWETRLSAGEDKKFVFEDLMKTKQLGALAFIRNLRNMQKAGVSKDIIEDYARELDVSRVLPFRFITAARHNPDYEPMLEQMMFKAVSNRPKLKGKTVILVDVSGSMDAIISRDSEVMRYDTANGIAILGRELCDDVEIFSFSNFVKKIPARRGFALRDAISSSQDHSGTYLGKAVSQINESVNYDRIIVISDEQVHDVVPNPKGKGYMINVASYANGVGYGAWTHIDGWSDAIFDYITEIEEIKD